MTVPEVPGLILSRGINHAVYVTFGVHVGTSTDWYENELAPQRTSFGRLDEGSIHKGDTSLTVSDLERIP